METTSPAISSAVQSLAELFSGAIPMHIPVFASSLRYSGEGLSESVLIEYGTATEALFSSALPLEFGERVRLRNADSSFDAEASVVAVRFDQGTRAIAVRFSQKVPNWIVQ